VSYVVYNEDSEKMRIVGRQEEARQLVSKRSGWTFKFVKTEKKQLDLSQFEEAPF
jgi:ribosome biogenesis protein Tsr3